MLILAVTLTLSFWLMTTAVDFHWRFFHLTRAAAPGVDPDDQKTFPSRRDPPPMDPVLVAQFLLSAMESGATVEAAIRMVAPYCGAYQAARLHRSALALQLGLDWQDVWDESDPASALVKRVMSPIPDAALPADVFNARLDQAEADLQHAQEQAVEKLATYINVPLGLCGLPAFFAMGIVPVVACLFSSGSLSH